MSSTKYFIEIPFDLKHIAKANNCLWDMDAKKWYTLDADNTLINDYKPVILNHFNFDKKDFIKSNGGKYDSAHKQWSTYKSNEKLRQFM
jgi:hypothetical protein